MGGKLTDKFGFYDLQIFALLSGGIFFIILGYQHIFLTVGIGAFVLSFCNESFRPANSTAIAYYSTPENKTRSYSLNRLAVNLGWAFGGALGGFLASINYHSLFWADGCTNIVAALMLMKLIPRSGVVKAAKDKLQGDKGISAYKDKVYLAFILLTALFAICFFQLFTMQPLFFKIQWQFSVRIIGALMAFNGVLIAVIEMVVIHRLEGRRNGLQYICVGVILVGIGFVLLNVMPPHIFSGIVVMVFVTLGEILSMPFMNSFWIARTSDNNRGEYAGLYTMAWSAAQVVAPILAGTIVMYGGFNLLWWLVGGVSVLVSGGFMLLYKSIK